MSANYPVWHDLITAEEHSALDPGVPDTVDRRPDVLVVGGGILGVVTAVLLRRAGIGRVTLLERDTLGSGASGGAAGALAPDAHQGTEPASFVDLGRGSLALWRRLDAEWPGGLGVETVDWLALPPLPPGLTRELPPGAVRLSSADLVAAVPALAPVDGAVLIPGLARVNPLRALARLAASAGSVATGVTVTDVRLTAGRVVAAATSIGDVTPGAVVFATGLEPQLPSAPLASRGRLIKGHLLATAPAPFQLRVAARIPLQLENGSLISGGTLDEGDLSPEVRPAVIAAIKAELNKAIPAARELDVTHSWCCFRPVAADSLPVIDRFPGLDNAWFTSGHFRTGIMMAPATGRALAQWVTSGQPPREVSDFGCSRFTDGTLAGG